MRKMKPVIRPIPTQYIMILGPSMDACGISSIMCATASKPAQQLKSVSFHTKDMADQDVLLASRGAEAISLSLNK